MKKTLAKLFGGGKKAGPAPLPAADPEVENFLLRIPKVELQVQLESCLRPARILSLAAKHGLDLPFRSEADVRKLLRFDSAEQRTKVYDLLCKTLRDAEDIHLLALDFLAEQAMQNVRYSEVHVDVFTHLRRGIDGEGLRQALAEAASEGQRRHGVRFRVIAAIVREAGVDAADQVVDWALGDAGGLVAGIGLGGRESEPAAPYRPHFERAAATGFGLTARAGEVDGPQAIRAVLADCRPARLGHGVRASEDQELLTDLASRRTPLLICPSANVRCRLYRDFREHPFAELRQAGVEVSVHTDGGPLYDTNLTREYVRLHQAWELSPTELAELATAAIAPAFLTEVEKTALTEEVAQGISRLGVTIPAG